MRNQAGTKAWREHAAKLANAELRNPKRLFYISFSDVEFLGAVIVEANGPVTALARTHILKINPGGEALTHQLPEDAPVVPKYLRDRLLSKEELEKHLGPIKRMEQPQAILQTLKPKERRSISRQ